jgi:CPA2 family monovalent cation:H+ antiporter-2
VNALDHLNVPTVVVEVDMGLTRALAAAGTSVVWGDAANEEVLKEAHLDQAKLLVIAVPDESTTLLAVAGARRLNPAIAIVARARTGDDIARLAAAGVQEIVVPEYEGGLALMRQALASLGISEEDATEYADALRDTYYGPVVQGGSGRQASPSCPVPVSAAVAEPSDDP